MGRVGAGREALFTDAEVQKMTGHRSYASFRDLALSLEMPEADAEECWTTLMQGYLDQKTINAEAGRVVAELDALWRSKNDFDARILEILEELSSEPKNWLHVEMQEAFRCLLGILDEQGRIDMTKNLLRSANACYIDFVEKIAEHLRVPDPKQAALWSGGRRVSDYAAAAGRCPLEQTAMGKLLDTLEIHADWDLEAPLWNLLSQAFTAQEIEVMHVYFWTADETSVLLRQEVPLLKLKNPDCKVFWHPLVQLKVVQGGVLELEEVGLDERVIHIDKSNQGFSLLTGALQAQLRAFNAANPRTNLRSKKNRKIPGIKNSVFGLAPFATDESPNWGMVGKYERLIMGRA